MQVKPGDVLFYFDDKGLTRLIEIGEKLQEHDDGPWPIHVAIALGPEDKLEADFLKTDINPIGTRPYVICRPPYPSAPKLARALAWGCTRVGRLYGWIGIVDQFLRDISNERAHLPEKLMKWINNLFPFCSTLVASIELRAGIDVPIWPPPSPADCWRVLKQYSKGGVSR